MLRLERPMKRATSMLDKGLEEYAFSGQALRFDPKGSADKLHATKVGLAEF